MEIAFDAIGLEIPNERAFNNLVQDAGKRGEASRLMRKEGVLHGRCWRLGEGLEVWTVLYESQTGEVFKPIAGRDSGRVLPVGLIPG